MRGIKSDRRLLAPEVVQTSSMDCGPAALKCLLEGFGIPVSYGRLREACQTGVDGTSIDNVELVANQLGLRADQSLLPEDHLSTDSASTLPAVVVVRHNDGATHFVVVWRRVGRWLQVMDPAVGRRWVSARRFLEDVYRHEESVAAADWREWAGSDEFVAPLDERLVQLGIRADAADALVEEATADPHWFPLAALDAAVRLVRSLVDSGGVDRGMEARGLVSTLFHGILENPDDIYALVPRTYWSIAPDAEASRPGAQMLKVRGMVLVRVVGLGAATDDLSPELAAAIGEQPTNPLETLWSMLRADGLLAPLAVVAALALGTGVVMLEALLFRGLFDIAAYLVTPAQRIAAATSLLALLGLLLAIEFPVLLETVRQGRQLELRLRMALFRKLPRLNDRYFASRPISDMADRSHSIQLVRNVPSLGFRAVQGLFEIVLTLAGIILVAPASALLAVALVVVSIGFPFVTQSLLNERDLRVRNQSGTLYGFYLDALVGLIPIRAHRAEDSIRRQHETLLVDWARSTRGLMRLMLLSGSAQSLLCSIVAGLLLFSHFAHSGAIAGSDLLLIFWTLKLPGAGSALAGVAQQYPVQRNVLLRLLEPLSAPEEEMADAASAQAPATATGIAITDGMVVAGGHSILSEVTLTIDPGEHVAIVGVSGAGKSSLLGVLLGWHRLAEGNIAIDGAPLDPVRLRATTAWVDPAIQIWNRSMLDNLQYASAGTDEIDAASIIEKAELRGVVEKLPAGLQSLLGEGGCMLSGGEGQRVRLGRALFMKDPGLVLLDEPFRGLDRGQRKALLGEARGWWKDATLICVTHDLWETLSFKRVLVVENGRIVEDGSPETLVSGETRYRELIVAETLIRDTFLRGDGWRQLRVEDGRVINRPEAA